jgi:hydroxymethylglutaryl-CoA lyase
MTDIVIHEVGMRDGLQIEKKTVPTEQKIKWIESLMDSGVDIIQVGSFVHPEKVPQMADTDTLFRYFSTKGKKNLPDDALQSAQRQAGKNVILSGLVLNEKGLDRGLNCGVEMFCMGVSASETHSKKNTGMTTSEALDRIIPMAKKALSAGKKVQVSVQSAFGCSYEGAIPEEKVIDIVKRYLDAEIKMISLADTSGMANPMQVEKLFSTILKLAPDIECACHFHDTYGLGLANVYAAYKTGVKYFESAFAGLGGCPFTAKTSGNVCTEDMAHMFQSMGIRQDINLKSLISISKQAEQFFERKLPGVVCKTRADSKE